jgi:hypothetical protein
VRAIRYSQGFVTHNSIRNSTVGLTVGHTTGLGQLVDGLAPPPTQFARPPLLRGRRSYTSIGQAIDIEHVQGGPRRDGARFHRGVAFGGQWFRHVPLLGRQPRLQSGAQQGGSVGGAADNVPKTRVLCV